MEKSFFLDELIDLKELQSIQNSFARAVGISSVIFSDEGEPLTKFTNPTGFCSLIQSTEKGKKRCFRSFMEKIAIGAQWPEICYCFAHGGHFVAPIIIDGKHKGTMFAGQFTPEKFSPKQLHDLEKIAHEIDLDPGLLVKEAGKMRVVREAVIRNYSSLLFKVVETIARRGVQAAELISAKDALQKTHDELERRLKERTIELAEANKGFKHEITEQKIAEELQKEKNRAQHYLDVSGVMFLVIGTDQKVSLINRKGCEILGYKKEEEIVGKDWFANFIPERLRDEVARVFESLIAGKIDLVEYYENPVLTKHGKERIVAWHNTILRDEQGRIYATMASGEDITEQKAAVRESEEKYRTIYDSSKDAIMTLTPEEGFLSGNPAAVEIFGFKSEKELILQTPHDLSPQYQPDGALSSKKTKQMMAIAMEKGSHLFEWTHKRIDGKEFFSTVLLTRMELQGRRVLQATVRNITEQKAAETALRESEEKIRMITASANDAIMMMDHKGNISYWNKAAEQMFDYTEEEIIGKDLHALLVPERFHAGFSKGFEKFKETGQGAALGKTVELAAFGKDGKEFSVELSLSAVKLKGGWNAIGLIRDITERKAAEGEIKKKNR